MDKENNHHSGGGFFNGFILGLLVGAGLVFLFGTSKGKRVLQMLLEQVEENTELSELLEIPEGEEEEEYMDAIEEEPEVEVMDEEEDIRHEFANGRHHDEDHGHDHNEHEHHEHHEHHERHEHHTEAKPQKTVAKVKRFFRGSPKKLVS